MKILKERKGDILNIWSEITEVYIIQYHWWSIFFNSLVALATANHYVGVHLKCIRPTEEIFNPEDPKIREVRIETKILHKPYMTLVVNRFLPY